MFNSKQVEGLQDAVSSLGQDVNDLYQKNDDLSAHVQDVEESTDVLLDDLSARLRQLEDSVGALAAGADQNFQSVLSTVARVARAVELVAAAGGKELYKTEAILPSYDPGKPSEVAIRKLGTGAKLEKKASKKLSAGA